MLVNMIIQVFNLIEEFIQYLYIALRAHHLKSSHLPSPYMMFIYLCLVRR